MGLLAIASCSLLVVILARAATPPSPESVAKYAGVYQDPTVAPEFQNTILVTAANFNYITVLENWECSARKLGLKWLVVAMDQKMFDSRTEGVMLATHTEAGKGRMGFRSAGFNKISCGKMDAVYHILDELGYNVVFSDPDAVLARDPFKHQLGKLAAGGQCDYIYQLNGMFRSTLTPDTHANLHIVGGENNGNVVGGSHRESNTGLYFARASSAPLMQVFKNTLERCDADTTVDDQTHFWRQYSSIDPPGGCTLDPAYYMTVGTRPVLIVQAPCQAVMQMILLPVWTPTPFPDRPFCLWHQLHLWCMEIAF
jgi:hypothetical protein